MGYSRQFNTVVGCFIFVAAVGLILAIVSLFADNFRIGRGDSIRHSEVKYSVHQVQLALERFSADHDGEYPLFVMGGDWTDSYVVTEQHREAAGLELPEDSGYFGSMGKWEPAPQEMGDRLIMEGYLPEYPANPFKRSGEGRIRLGHMDHRGRLTERYCGGSQGSLMVEIFGPQLVREEQPLAGDFFVHHIFNDPAYTLRDIRKQTTAEGGEVDFAKMSGNPWLVGNFSYYVWMEDAFSTSLKEWDTSSRVPAGYTLAGYGSSRTHGQDVYNRNGNYKGRYRTENCDIDCSPAPLFPNDIPCICPGDTSPPSSLQNNGGPDTLPDGVIICLESGVDRPVNSGSTESDVDETPAPDIE